MRRAFDSLIIVGAAMFVMGAGGQIEGWMNPVVSPSDVLSIEPWEDEFGQSGYDVSLFFRKLRDCDYKSITFRRANDKSIGFEVITPNYGSRQPASWETGWRLIDVTPLDIGEMSIKVVHRCPWRPYDTITNMSPRWK